MLSRPNLHSPLHPIFFLLKVVQGTERVCGDSCELVRFDQKNADLLFPRFYHHSRMRLQIKHHRRRQTFVMFV